MSHGHVGIIIGLVLLLSRFDKWLEWSVLRNMPLDHVARPKFVGLTENLRLMRPAQRAIGLVFVLYGVLRVYGST